jgi:23S rRNA (cytidine1920-2'-O)/16S rRNA (cytidine1409-2'-O)-methyltransferase
MRLDAYLVLKEKIPSRTRAQKLIEEGSVSVNGKVVMKPAQKISDTDRVVLTGSDIPWVSRGALKLLAAFDEWKINVKGKVCLDIGASTGGFTEVLLERGAKKVFALDVGHGQLHEKIQHDPRVVSMEGTNIRQVFATDLPEPIEFIVVDVSFISLELVLPHVFSLLSPQGSFVALVKPQFEVGKENIKKGIVVDEKLRLEALEKIVVLVKAAGFKNVQTIDSPIEGGDGNKEFLMFVSRV